MALLQLHHQFSDGSTEMKAQQDVDTSSVHAFVRKTMENFPLPKGARWLAVEETSPLFVLIEKT